LAVLPWSWDCPRILMSFVWIYLSPCPVWDVWFQGSHYLDLEKSFFIEHYKYTMKNHKPLVLEATAVDGALTDLRTAVSVTKSVLCNPFQNRPPLQRLPSSKMRFFYEKNVSRSKWKNIQGTSLPDWCCSLRLLIWVDSGEQRWEHGMLHSTGST
jgi:hypothetical protein